MEKYSTGTEVGWSGDTAHGTVAERFTQDVTRIIEGTQVERSASGEEPARLIGQADGDLKSHSELRSIVGMDRHVPPEAVARVVERGLALRERLKRQGKRIGIAHARDLKNRRAVSDSTIRHMARFFARRDAAGQAPEEKEGDEPSPDYVSFLLWGGAPGREWAARERASLDAAGR